MVETAKVAVLDANYRNLVKQLKDHEDRDEERFERSFEFNQNMKHEILERIGDLDDKFTQKFIDLQIKVEPLWDEKNKREGASRASKFILHAVSGAIGGLFGLGVALVKK